MPAPSGSVEGYPYPRTQPLLLDHGASSYVVQVSEIEVALVPGFLLVNRRRCLHHGHHLHRRPPES